MTKEPDSEPGASAASASSAEYVPPKNAVRDLLNSAPADLRRLMHEQMEEVTRANPVGDWPFEPYHYGMGRIMEYEMWLGWLSEEERQREIAASRTRYEAHYQRDADLLADRMRELGHDIQPRTKDHDEPDNSPPHDTTNPGENAREALRKLREHKAERPGPRTGQGRGGPSLGGRGR